MEIPINFKKLNGIYIEFCRTNKASPVTFKCSTVSLSHPWYVISEHSGFPVKATSLGCSRTVYDDEDWPSPRRFTGTWQFIQRRLRFFKVKGLESLEWPQPSFSVAAKLRRYFWVRRKMWQASPDRWMEPEKRLRPRIICGHDEVRDPVRPVSFSTVPSAATCLITMRFIRDMKSTHVSALVYFSVGGPQSGRRPLWTRSENAWETGTFF